MSPNRPTLFSLCLLATALPLTASAQLPQELAQQRESYLQIDRQLATQRPTATEMEALQAYPLYPYLEYRVLRSNLKDAEAEEVTDFFERNRKTPLYGRLIFAWAKQQGEAGEWEDFLPAWNAIQRPDTELKCLHARYLLESGKIQQAWQAARPLWRVGYSQPDTCDPVFKPWLTSHNFTSADALERYLLALENGRPALASYVEDFLKEDSHKQTAKLARTLYSSPAEFHQNARLMPDAQQQGPRLLELAVRRLARKDLNAAIELWIRERDRFPLAAAEAAKLTEYMGVWLAKRFPEGDERQLLAKLDPDHQYSRLQEWRIRLMLVDGDWEQVDKSIALLPENERNSDRWQYWRAIARNHLKSEGSTSTLGQLSGERSFYGFMAAQILNQPYELNDTPHAPAEADLDALAQQPAFQRIAELLTLERYGDARSEWNLAIRDMTDDQIMNASHLMQRWGWHHQGIRGAISSKRWNDMALRFPNPYPDLYLRHASEQDIDPYWALAVTRQESAFWMGARSRVGARGLMQLMPATAKAVARRHGIAMGSLASLSKPDLNIRLGSAYLSEMIQRFNGNQAFASAAYNAGPHRVSQWLKSRGDLPLDIWIETIPYDETRQYVQNVLAFRVIYRQQDKQNVALFSQQEFSQLALNQ